MLDKLSIPRRIDTNLTAAYLRAVQDELEAADESIKTLMDEKRDWNQLARDLQRKDEEIEILRAAVDRLVKDKELLSLSGQPQWHPSTEIPKDDERVIVRHRDGATFMYEPVNGKWPQWVDKWMYIPQ